VSRRNDRYLDHLTRQAAHVTDEEVERGWAGSRSKDELREEIIMMSALPDVDTPPAERSDRPQRRLGVLVAAGVLVLASGTTLLLWPSQSSPAFAGWTPAPQPVTEAALDGIQQMCGSEFAEGPPQVLDQRGGSAVARWWIDVDGAQQQYGCWAFDTDGDGAFDAGGSIEFEGPAGEVGPDSYDRETAQAAGPAGDEHIITTWTGRVEPSVERVAAIRSDGSEVEATLAEEGYFLVWWPAVGDAPDLQAIVTQASDGTSGTSESWSPTP